VATATFNNTTIRPLISVDWLHRGKLPLQVQDRGLCGLDGSSFSRSLTDSYHGYATSRITLLTSAKSRQISPLIINRSVMERIVMLVRCWASLASLVLAFLVF